MKRRIDWERVVDLLLIVNGFCAAILLFVHHQIGDHSVPRAPGSSLEAIGDFDAYAVIILSAPWVLAVLLGIKVVMVFRRRGRDEARPRPWWHAPAVGVLVAFAVVVAFLVHFNRPLIDQRVDRWKKDAARKADGRAVASLGGREKMLILRECPPLKVGPEVVERRHLDDLRQILLADRASLERELLVIFRAHPTLWSGAKTPEIGVRFNVVYVKDFVLDCVRQLGPKGWSLLDAATVAFGESLSQYRGSPGRSLKPLAPRDLLPFLESLNQPLLAGPRTLAEAERALFASRNDAVIRELRAILARGLGEPARGIVEQVVRIPWRPPRRLQEPAELNLESTKTREGAPEIRRFGPAEGG